MGSFCMLNELAILAKSLQQFNVPVEPVHPWVKTIPKKATLILGLNAQGFVTSLELMDKLQAARLCKIQQNNHSNFPALNWDKPVWLLKRETLDALERIPKRDLQRRVAFLKTACGSSPLATGQSKTIPDQLRFLNAVLCQAKTYLERMGNFNERGFESFRELLRRVLDVRAQEEWFRRATSTALEASSTSASLLDVAQSWLTELDSKGSKVPVVLDLSDCTQFACRVADPRMSAFYTRFLNSTESPSGSPGICSLTGDLGDLELDTLPSPNLPELGKTVLMSMFGEAQCNKRYNHTGASVFPIAKRTASLLNASLHHLIEPRSERRGRTWNSVPGPSRRSKNGLLVAYLATDPEFNGPLAEAFSEPDRADEVYSKLCEKIGTALEGRDVPKSALVRIVILRKIDLARAQVHLDLSVSARQILEGGKEWEVAANNSPRLRFKTSSKPLFPSAVVRVLQKHWIRGGADFRDASGCGIQDVYRILIADMPDARQSANALLTMTVRQYSALLISGSSTFERNKKTGTPDAKQHGEKRLNVARQAYSDATTLLATLLYKLGYELEIYMTRPAFLLGRFHAFVDALHLQYCENVRDGDVPPQLLGNALIPVTLNDPADGLARLAERIRIYQAWAVQQRGGLAGWTLQQLGTISYDLAPQIPGQRMSDTDKAQFLLGYLARAPKAPNGSEDMMEETTNDKR